MAIAATLLTSGSSTTNDTTDTTASVTPAADSLVFAINLHVAAAADYEVGKTCVGNGITYLPIASIPVDAANFPSETAALTVWAGQAAAPSAGTIVFTFFGTQLNGSWAIVQVTGHDTTTPTYELPGLGAIRRTGMKSNSSARTDIEIPMGNFRSASNGILFIGAHLVNEATTPGSGLTELADVATAEGTALEVSWSATPVYRPGMSWATSTASSAGIAIELAVPSNTSFVADPVADLYT